MHRYITYIAILLLLLFCRVMIPDALLVSLHAHTHTEHAVPNDPEQEQLGEKHNHCPVENLFGAPYQGEITSVELLSVQHVVTLASPKTEYKQGAITGVQCLRGPPLV